MGNPKSSGPFCVTSGIALMLRFFTPAFRSLGAPQLAVQTWNRAVGMKTWHQSGDLSEGQMIDGAFTDADSVGRSDLQPSDMCELWIRGPDAARVHVTSVRKTSTLADACEKYRYMSQFRAQVDGRQVPWNTPVHLLSRQVVLIVATGLLGGSPGVHLQASNVDAPCGGDDRTLHCPCVGGSAILNQPKPSNASPVHRGLTLQVQPSVELRFVLPDAWGPFKLKVHPDATLFQCLRMVNKEKLAGSCFVDGMQQLGTACARDFSDKIIFLGMPDRPPKPLKKDPVPVPVNFLGSAAYCNNLNMESGKLTSLLVRNFTLHEINEFDLVYHGDLLDLETTRNFDELPVLAAVFVHVNRVLDCPSDGILSLYNVQTTGQSGHFLLFDGTSSCSSIARCHKPPWNVFELFSGGFGGWSCAIQGSVDLQEFFHVNAAWDHCYSALTMYRLNHGGTILTIQQALDQSFRSQRWLIQDSFDVKGAHQLQHHLQCPVWVASLPCQSWSNAGNACGLDDFNGQVWFDFAKALNVARPAVVLLENVSSIVKHKHAPKIVQLMSQAHYASVWECPEAKLDELSCTSRPRWLAILVDQFAVQTRPDSFQPKMNLFRNLALSLHQIIPFELPHEMEQQLNLSPDAFEAMINPDFARCFHRSPLHWRNVFRTNKLHTAMASYLTAHEIPAALLASKGLFSQLVPDVRFATGYRLIAPVEHALALIISSPLHMLPSLDESMHCIGNAISPVHAGLALAVACKVLKSDVDCKIPHPEDVIACLLAGKYTKSNAEIVTQPDGTFALVPKHLQIDGTQHFHPCCAVQVLCSGQAVGLDIPADAKLIKACRKAICERPTSDLWCWIPRTGGVEATFLIGSEDTVGEDGIAVCLPAVMSTAPLQALLDVATVMQHLTTLRGRRPIPEASIPLPVFVDCDFSHWCWVDSTQTLEHAVPTICSSVKCAVVALEMRWVPGMSPTAEPVVALCISFGHLLNCEPLRCFQSGEVNSGSQLALPSVDTVSVRETQHQCDVDATADCIVSSAVEPSSKRLRPDSASMRVALGIGMAGNQTCDIMVDPSQLVWDLAGIHCGPSAGELVEIRANGHPVPLHATAAQFANQVIRCHLKGLSGGAVCDTPCGFNVSPCSVDGQEQLVDSWMVRTPAGRNHTVVTRIHRCPRTRYFCPDEVPLPPGIARGMLTDHRTSIIFPVSHAVEPIGCG